MNDVTYQELKEKLEALGLIVDLNYSRSLVGITAQDLGAPMGGDTTIFTIDKHTMNTYSVYDYSDTLINYDDWLELCALVQSVAHTPISRRGTLEGSVKHLFNKLISKK